jgi:hypothetical protein
MRIWIKEPPECVSRSETLVDVTQKSFEKNFVFGGGLREHKTETFRKRTIPGTKLFCEKIRGNKNFSKNIRKSEKKIFAKRNFAKSE